jgi:hypothetical protein
LKEFVVNKALIIFAGLFLMGFSSIFASGNGERGNGDKITSERTVSFFDEIEINYEYNNIRGNTGGAIILRIHSDREYRASVDIDSNLDQYVEVINEDNKLKIKLKQKVAKDFIVNVYCPNILGITIDGLGRVEFVDTMITPSLKIDIDGAGKVNGAIECKNLYVDIDGAGDIEISGSSNEASIAIDGAGKFNGYEFKINNGIFDIDGAGSIKCWTVDNLTASISGVGSIRYHGNPNINKSRSGLGSIKKAK